MPHTLFFLSPANLGGERAALLFNPNATFPLARQVRSPEGAPLGAVFSFVSGLYFRGKLTYANAFASVPAGLSGSLVISPAEGLRFAHEPVTLDRLRAWAEQDVDEQNPRFTKPLIAHAQALADAFVDARFVLLGSVATDKYVGPLTQVFGRRLLFPPSFAGRGDMSRGALLLRAARANSELEYVPVEGARRHAPRPSAAPVQPHTAPRASSAPAPSVVLFVGLQGAGKSTFYRQRFAASHLHISKDNFRNNRQPERHQLELLRRALAAGDSVVIDNTNASPEQRKATIIEAQRHGARVIGYFFDSTTAACLNRNRQREGRARIPEAGVLATAKRLVRPALAEGFDELYTVRTLADHCFECRLEERREPGP